MTTKEKYELIDKTKINEKILTILRNMEQSSSNFTDEAVNSKIDGALEKLIEQIRANKPEALRTLPEAKKEVKKEKEKAIKKNEGKDFSDKKDTDDKTGLPKKDTLEERKDIIKEESETEKEARDRAKKELEKEKEKAKDEIESQIEKLNRLILEDPALRGFNTGSAATGGGRSTPIIDAERKALPRGSRVSQKGWQNQYGASKGGRKYWENRENRSDRKSPEYETGKPYLAKGGNVYSSDEMYLIAMFKGDVDLDTISIRAKNKAEARMIFEDTYREKYEDKLGDFAIEIYLVKPFPESDSYAQGGVIKAKNYSDWDWGKIYEKVNIGLGESFVTILPKNSDGGKIKYGLIIRDASNQFDRSSNISYIFDLDDKYYPNDRQDVKDTISSPYYDKDTYKEIARGSHLLVITIQGNRKTLLKDLIDKVNYTFFSKINRRNEMDLPISYPNRFLYDLLVFEGSISDLVDFVEKLQSAFQYEGAKLYTETTPYIMSIIWNIPESTDYRNSVITPATYIPIFELANEVEAKTSKKRKYADGGEVPKGGYKAYANWDTKNNLGVFDNHQSARDFAVANMGKYDTIVFEDSEGDTFMTTKNSDEKYIDYLFFKLYPDGKKMADGGKLDEEISKIKSLGGDWQSYDNGRMAGKKDDGYVTIENEADLNDYIYDKTGYIVKNIEVIEKEKNYPYNRSNPYFYDTYLVTLKNGSNFTFERSYGRPNWQGNVNYIERIKITNINTKQTKGDFMADGGEVSKGYKKFGELQGKFLAEIKVPYNYESVVEDEFEFTEFLSKTLTKKWFGNGVWRVKMVKPLFEKDYSQRIVVEIEIPVGVTQGGGLDKFDVVEFMSKTLTKKWFGNGIWGVDVVKSFADGGEVSKGYKKFGEDNLQLVNFDLSELDDYEEMQFNHALKSFSKAESLQVLINTVEGDYSQLDERLAEIAEEQYPSEEFFENTRDYANGGEVEGVDLFEDYDDQPEEVQAILTNYEMEDNDYETLQNLKAELESIGYTMDFGLDAEPYDLRKIGEKGKSEFYAKGGMMADGNSIDAEGEIIKKGYKVTNGRGLVGIVKEVQTNGLLYIQWISANGEEIRDLMADNDPKELYIINDKYGDGGMMADGGITNTQLYYVWSDSLGEYVKIQGDQNRDKLYEELSKIVITSFPRKITYDPIKEKEIFLKYETKKMTQGDEMAHGGEMENRRTLKFSDAVLYKDEMYEFVKKDGELGFVSHSQGAWGMNGRFLPLGRMYRSDLEENLTDMYGNKFYIPNYEDLVEMPYGFAKGGMMADGGKVLKKGYFAYPSGDEGDELGVFKDKESMINFALENKGKYGKLIFEGIENGDILEVNKGDSKDVITWVFSRIGMDTKEANKKVKMWFISNYPADEEGEQIDETVTFDDIWFDLKDQRNIYYSLKYPYVIREVFEKIATIYGVENDFVDKMYKRESYAKGGMMADGGEMENRRTLKFSDAVLYKDEMYEFVKKDGELGFVSHSQGAWGMNGRFLPLGRMYRSDLEENLTDMYGKKFYIPNYEELMEMPYGFAKGGMMADGGTVNRKELNKKIKDYYIKTYPTDKEGKEINDKITFKGFWAYLSQGYNVYDVLEVADSLIRERVFEKLSEIYAVDYDVVYNMWLRSDKYDKGGQMADGGETTKSGKVKNLEDAKNWVSDRIKYNKVVAHKKNVYYFLKSNMKNPKYPKVVATYFNDQKLDENIFIEQGYSNGGYMSDGIMMADGGETNGKYREYEMVVLSKNADGKSYKYRFLISARNIDEAKQIATDGWHSEFGDMGETFYKVMTDSKYRMDYGMADGGELNGNLYRVGYLKVYENDEEGDTVYTKEIYGDSEEDVSSKFKKIHPKHKIEFISKYADGGMMADGGEIRVGDTIYRAWFTDDDGEKHSRLIKADSQEEAEIKAEKISNEHERYSYVSNPIQIKNSQQLFEETNMAKGGMMTDGGEVDFEERMAKMRNAYENLNMIVKSRIAVAVGIDRAISIMERDYSIDPFGLITSAVRGGLLELDEINKDLVNEAVYEAERVTDDYRDSGQGIGGSDMTYFTKSVLDGVGYKTGFVNNRLTRVDADGNELVIDKYEMNY